MVVSFIPPLLSGLCPQSHSHRTARAPDRRPPRPDDYDEEELGDESVQAAGSKIRRPIHPPASDPIRRYGLRRVPAAALPDPGGQRPPLPHRPHHQQGVSAIWMGVPET